MLLFYAGKDKDWKEMGKLAGSRENHMQKIERALSAKAITQSVCH